MWRINWETRENSSDIVVRYGLVQVSKHHEKDMKLFLHYLKKEAIAGFRVNCL